MAKKGLCNNCSEAKLKKIFPETLPLVDLTKYEWAYSGDSMKEAKAIAEKTHGIAYVEPGEYDDKLKRMTDTTYSMHYFVLVPLRRPPLHPGLTETQEFDRKEATGLYPQSIDRAWARYKDHDVRAATTWEKFDQLYQGQNEKTAFAIADVTGGLPYTVVDGEGTSVVYELGHHVANRMGEWIVIRPKAA